MRKDIVVIELPESKTNDFWETMKKEMLKMKTDDGSLEMTLLNKGVMDDHFPGFNKNPEWWKAQYGVGGHA